MKNRILNIADKLFLQQGIRSVTLDRIAKKCGISKKTIYLHFNDKKGLVYELAKSRIEELKNLTNDKAQQINNPIEEILKHQKIIQESLSEINPSYFYDLQHYYPRAWDIYLSQKEYFKNKMLENIQRGQKQGLYLPNLNAEILANFKVETFEMIINPDLFPVTKFNLLEVENTVLDNFVRGILTPDGLEIYEKINTI